MKLSKDLTIPYILAGDVPEAYLNWAMLNSVTTSTIKTAVMADTKLYRKMKAKLVDSYSVELLNVELAFEMKNHFNFYNALAKEVLMLLTVDIEDFLPKLEKSKSIHEASIIAFSSFTFDEVIAILRLHKKGKYAEKYIPALLKEGVETDQLEKASDLFYEILTKNGDDWYEKAVEAFKTFAEKAEEEMEEQITPEHYKEKFAALLNEFEEACKNTDSAHITELTNQVALEKEEKTALEKQVKSKDTQIKKLQKDLAELQKSEKNLQQKVDEAKKLQGQKSAEVGELRKELEASKSSESYAMRKVESLQDEQSKIAGRVERELVNAHKSEISKLQDNLSSEIDALTEVNLRLTSELKKEREQAMEAEQLVTNYEAFKIQLTNKTLLLQQKVEKLQQQNEELLMQNKQLQHAAAATSITQPVQQSAVDTIKIADDVFDDLLLVNKPVEHAQTESSTVGEIASVTSQYDEDEFDLFALVENKPE